VGLPRRVLVPQGAAQRPERALAPVPQRVARLLGEPQRPGPQVARWGWLRVRCSMWA